MKNKNLSNPIKKIFKPSRAIQLPKEISQKQGYKFFYKGQTYIPHTSLDLGESAFFRITKLQLLYIIPTIVLIAELLIQNFRITLIGLLAVITISYFIDLLFNFYLIYKSFKVAPELKVSNPELNSNIDWPTYTIFCPLYKEWEVLPQFIKAISNLDYPNSQLQVLLLLEEDDKETIKQISKISLPHYFQAIVIPHSYPKTKPKACNYGLGFAKGEYSVIYDAEDAPESDQLKKAVMAFRKSPDDVICVQAKLNFYNPYQNILTKLFTSEYSLWFDLVLTGLQSIGAPIPLGGTSNHFKTKDLISLQGWDSFNVTEDCDLGIRLTKKGFQTAMIDSTTYEEANSEAKNWFNQRTRWIKGYIQTYLVHTRNPSAFIKSKSLNGFFKFQMIVGGKILAMFVNPLMWIITISYFVFRPIIGPAIESVFPTPILYIGVISLIGGNFLYLYYYMIGAVKRGYFDLVKYSYLIPFYWIAMSLAAWVAVYRLITQPHYWSKTKHGLHLIAQDHQAESINELYPNQALVNL